MCAKFSLPKVSDIGLQEVLECILAGGILEEGEGVREVLGETDISKPVPTTLA